MAYTDINNLAEILGTSIWIIVLLLIWTMTWKLLALWKSARKGSLIWFIVLGLVNTLGILEILYIFIFSKMDFKQGQKQKPKKKKR